MRQRRIRQQKMERNAVSFVNTHFSGESVTYSSAVY